MTEGTYPDTVRPGSKIAADRFETGRAGSAGRAAVAIVPGGPRRAAGGSPPGVGLPGMGAGWRPLRPKPLAKLFARAYAGDMSPTPGEPCSTASHPHIGFGGLLR